MVFSLRTVGDRPEVKYINRHVKEKVCGAGPEVWLDLGIQLLEKEDVPALLTIKSDVSECSDRCSKMFNLWLERRPKASWSNLIEALKLIHQDKLASDIVDLLSIRKQSEEVGTVDGQQTFGQDLLQVSHSGMCRTLHSIRTYQ